MGCGVSKHNQDHKQRLGRIRPIICSRFYQIRANRNSTSPGCPSIESKITEAFANVEAKRSIKALAEPQRRGKKENIDEVNITQEEKNATDDNKRRMLSHESLSFRVYCRDSADHILDLVEQEDLDEYIDADSIAEGQRIGTNEESVCSNEIAAKEAPKKGIRMSMFKKMPARDANASFSFSNGLSENAPLLHKAVPA